MLKSKNNRFNTLSIILVFNMNVQTIEKEILRLPIEDRARLAEKLLSSLDTLSEPEIERLWFVEAQRRAGEIDNGIVQLVTAEEVESRIQSILK